MLVLEMVIFVVVMFVSIVVEIEDEVVILLSLMVGVVYLVLDLKVG